MIDKIEKFFLDILRKIKLEKLADWYMEKQEAMRYLIFGALSTVVNIVAFAIFENIFKMGTIGSNIIAWIVAVIFAYVTNKLYVFNSKTNGKSDLLREITSFAGARIFTLIIETIILKIFIDKLGFNSIFMKVISNIIVIILNFVFSKLFIFKKNAQED